MTVRPLTEETFNDAKSVVLARFSDSALGVLAKTMKNPLRRDCPEIGEIVYEESGRAVGFRAANRRRMHFCQELLLGRVRGLTCRLKDSSKEVMSALCEAQLLNPRGCKIAFSNTQSVPTEQRAIQMGATLGPKSCTRFLCCIIRPLRFFIYFMAKILLKKDAFKGQKGSLSNRSEFKYSVGNVIVERAHHIDKKFFDSLNEDYMKANEGIASDRDGESLSWLFENEVEHGQVVFLCARQNDAGVGYIALKADSNASHWLVVDWFALKNDSGVLSVLLRSAKRFLKQCTPALVCKVIGFPEYVQPLLKKHFPFERKTNVNWFSYNFLDTALADKCSSAVIAERSWFFGPLDGDFCM